MDTVTRRKFLQLTAGAVAVGAAAPLLSVDEIAAAAVNRPLAAGTPIVVMVTLYGGNDGLNTVIPYTDSLYFSSRPEISYKADTLLPLDAELALNPAMKGLKSLWDQKKVAIIRGVGYPNPDRSHFSSMAKWQTASPEKHINTGWLGRWIDTQAEDSMLAISLGSVLPPLFAGAKRSGSVLPLGGLVIPKGSVAANCLQLAKVSRADNSLMAAAATSMRNLFSVSTTVQPILKAPAPVAVDLPVTNGGNAGGDSNLAQQLDVVAKLIAAGSPTKIWSVSLGGFDTHANEANAQAALLGSVSDSITRFISQMKSTSRSADVTVVVYSEFGRRVVGNGSQGTDHGTSGPMFIVGEKVNGDFYGDQPSLKNLVNGDLAVTTDFRDVYATILESLLKSPVEPVLGKWSGRTNFLKA
ncbi:Twin-arginine translocation pathway, signal sequence, bacterial/archaeal [Candidatus Nanopelagicaceae bacterium]